MQAPLAKNYPSPENFKCRHVFSKYNNPIDGKIGEYRMELILPIHNLLGVNFKPFIKVEANNKYGVKIAHVMQLFASNFGKKENALLSRTDDTEIERNDPRREANTLYFCISPNYRADEKENETYDTPEHLTNTFGKYCDYLYPQ